MGCPLGQPMLFIMNVFKFGLVVSVISCVMFLLSIVCLKNVLYICNIITEYVVTIDGI